MNMSLKTKMALAVSLLFILFSLAMTWFTLSFFQRRFEAGITAHQAHVASLTASSINNRLAMARTALGGATAKVTPGTVSRADTAREYLNSRPTLQAIFDDGIYLFTARGRFIAESSYLPRHLPEEILQIEQLSRTTASTGKPGFSRYRFPNGKRGVLISVPIADGAGRTYAIMAGGMDLNGKNFAEETSRFMVGDTGFLYVYDTVHNMIIHQNRTPSLQALPNGAESLLKGRASGTGITYDPQLGPMITSFDTLNPDGWVVVTNLPQAEAYKPLVEARKFFLLATVSGTMAFLLLAWFLMRRFMEPLQQMIRHIASVADRPEEERYCTIDSRDEIGTLATAFNGMVAGLNNRQKGLEAAVKRAENEKARTDAIIATLGEGVSIQDRDFRILYQNRIHMELKGDCHGRYCYQAYEENEGVCDSCPVAMVFDDGQRHVVEKPVLLNGEGAYVELVASPLRDAAGEIVAAVEIARNVTARKRTEDEIRQLNRNLQAQAAELEVANGDLKAFGYSLSHDLKTPLTRVSLAAQALMEMYGDKLDDGGRFCIDSIEEGSRRMDEMIDGMLLLSGLSRSDLSIRKIDLGRIAAQIAQRLQDEEPGRPVEWSIEATPPVSGDARLLKSVLENLLGNSWKYTGKTAGPRIEFGSFPHGEGVAFFVRDNGPGFDPADREKIFMPFQRLDSGETFTGTGIGLATVQRIIQRHGGKIWAEGNPGHGATFYFTLPPAE